MSGEWHLGKLRTRRRFDDGKPAGAVTDDEPRTARIDPNIVRILAEGDRSRGRKVAGVK